MKSILTIALDSNIFRNLKFVDYLILHKAELDIALPMIVQLEVGYFYRLKGLSWDQFSNEMQKFNGKLMNWQIGLPSDIVDIAFENRQKLPFKDHIRDFLIGFQSEQEGRILITYNVEHFGWLRKYGAKKPEDLVVAMQDQ